MTAGRTPLQSGDAIAAQSDILASDAPLNLSLDLLLTEGKDLSDADLDRLAERSLFFAPKIVRQPNRTVSLCQIPASVAAESTDRFDLTMRVLKAVIAIPVCNEQAHIAACLGAIAAQRGVANHLVSVLLFLNNCADDTEAIVAALRPTLDFPLRVLSCEHDHASAGWARRCAMEAAAAWLEEDGCRDGALLTTDADSRVPLDWVARNLAALEGGADAVAGRLALDPGDAAALPPALHARGILETRYETLLTEIVARLDPVEGDPWPMHWSHSGASIATRLSTYRAIGGMPNIACGEDRAFFAAVLALDGIVRHDPDIVVVTSGRLDGRAIGGVADTIRLRCDELDAVCDDRLEPLGRVVMRTLLRRHLRRSHAAGRGIRHHLWARLLAINPEVMLTIDNHATFGMGHAALETASPRLVYRPLRPTGLPRQIRFAQILVVILRAALSRRFIEARLPPGLNRDRTAVEAFD